MSRLLCCLRARRGDMGAALSLSQPQEGEACDAAAEPAAPPTMADVIRERKKKAGGAALGTLRRRLAAAARRPRDSRPDRGCEHARFIRSVVSSWRLAEVFVLCEELEAGAALRDLVTQAELAREPAAALHADLCAARRERWWCDVELVGAGFSLPAHRAILAARCTYFRELMQRYPNACRVPLEGACASLSREEAEAAVCALYAGSALCSRPLCDLCAKWERGANAESDLDIINVENTGSRRSGSCACGRARSDARALRRLGELLGFSLDTLHRDMRYLLDSGELCDARLVFRLEAGCGAAYGFRSALELPCHRLLLAARSRFFRSVMLRRGTGSSGAVCVDEKVLPRRFARALLHAAYTDQVDLGLIGRNSSSPSSTNSTGSSGTAWGGVSRSSPRPTTAAALDDAFQLYEIARFVEMPIVVQGCEDVIVEALSAETLPHILRWAAAPHASRWVHRQAMRYLRDEFPAIMQHAASSALPRAALHDALASPFLQASEAQALRALVRWAERSAATHHEREPNVVWHTAHSASRRGRRREVSDAALREALATLVPLVRLEHLPPDSELLHQAVRRGVVPQPPPQMVERGAPADAWLARGSYRSPRCFLPYLDEIKALLEDQAVPEAEVARVRRARYLHRIPDTLYMVAAARNGAGSASSVGGATQTGGEAACVSPRVLSALRSRVRELKASPPAARALALHVSDTRLVHTQIALRAVREMSLPDSCAELLLAECDANGDRECAEEGWESPRTERAERVERREPSWTTSRSDLPDLPVASDLPDIDLDCCRSSGGSLRCTTGGARVSNALLHADSSATNTCRRELPPRPDAHRTVRGGRLSACVPDVAMAPNANTHLLTARDYLYSHPSHPPHPHAAPQAPTHVPTHVPTHATAHSAPHAHQLQALRPTEYGGGILQLDLGDGATHTPRPGSRAQRAAAQNARQHRESTQGMSCVRGGRSEDDELRAAIELSVMRAYSSLAGAGSRARTTASVPHYADLLNVADFGGVRSRATPSPSALSAGASGTSVASVASIASGGSAASVAGNGPLAGRRRVERHTPPPRLSLSHGSADSRSTGGSAAGSVVGSAVGSVGGTVSRSGSPSPSPSPRVRRDYSLYRHDYRSGGGASNGHNSGYA